MEYFKTTENHTQIDVYFDGEKYVFINLFYRLVAIARRDYENFSEDTDNCHAVFHVERTATIAESTIIRVIDKAESRYVKKSVSYDITRYDKHDSLPYFVSVKLEKRA